MIRTERAHLQVTARTHAGMSGKNNEDRYGVAAFRRNEQDATPVLLAVLADGIGGHRAGEVAAELAVNTFSTTLADSDAAQPLEALERGVFTASQNIYAHAQQEERAGMGSTCACALVIGSRLYTTSVGDSRIYLIRERSIRQLTVDHTWVQEAVELGILTREQARGHPNVHVIRRYLGSATPPEADFRLRLRPEETDEQMLANQGMRLRPGDRLLLCSDGLTDLVDPPEILSMLQDNPPEQAVEKLVNLANERGGHDNITILLLQTPSGSLALRNKEGGLRWGWVGAGCGALLILAAAAVLLLYQFRTLLPVRLPWERFTPTPALVTSTPVPTFTNLPPTSTLTPDPAYPAPGGSAGNP